MRILVDGVARPDLNLNASKTGWRRVVAVASWATSAKHTIEIRNVGTGRFDVDAFVVYY